MIQTIVCQFFIQFFVKRCLVKRFSVMHFRQQIIAGSGVLLLISCQPPAENRLQQLSNGCCECTTKLLELNQQMAQTPEKADFKTLEAEYQRTKECLTTVTNHLGKLKLEELPQLEKQLQISCPNLASQRELLQEMLVK